MVYEWTSERIAALTKAELNQLRENAIDRGMIEVAECCMYELDKRRPVRKGVRGNASVFRTRITRVLEKDAAELLSGVADNLTKRYDLSKATAKSLSVGCKRFIPHSLTDKQGRAKVGGAQRDGTAIFDRYISYRIRDEVYALTALMLGGDESPRYQVTGTDRLIQNGIPIQVLRPHLKENDVTFLTSCGLEFELFEEASVYFEDLFCRLSLDAPQIKRKN